MGESGLQRLKKDVINSFFEQHCKLEDRYIASRYHKNDRLAYDAEFVEKYIQKTDCVLDLGCGTGLMEDALHDKVKHITAVDKYKEFIEKANKYFNVTYKNEDIIKYRSDRKFEAILLFGVVMYLSDEECEILFEQCYDMLCSNDAVFIIKNQWGTKERVVVDGYSEGLNADYYAIYRSIDEICAMLKQKGFCVQVIDIYPPEMNLWQNTHEYVLLCKKINKED